MTEPLDSGPAAAEPTAGAPSWPRSVVVLGNVVGAIWIFGGMLFFFLRFSFVFYEANAEAISRVLARLPF